MSVVRKAWERWTRFFLSAWLPILLAAAAVEAQPTSYVPSLDPAYRDLDLLVAEGLVVDIIAGEKPHSRAAFARWIVEAQARADQLDRPLSARTEEAIERLARRFGTDWGSGVRRAFPGTLRGTYVEASAARAPNRGHHPDANLDGILNPILLQARQGREIVNGSTTAAEAWIDLNGNFLAAQFRPRIWLGIPRKPESTALSATFLEAYARTIVGPAAIQLGRGRLTLGHGQNGGPLLSENARGLDMLRIGMARPGRLPGILRFLGRWQLSGLFADMGDDRDVPGADLVVARLSGVPNRYLELGFNWMVLQGGEGARNANFWARLADTFYKGPSHNQESDKVGGADLRVTIPGARTMLYANFFSTDDRNRFQQSAGGYWEDAVWLAGGRVFGLGPGGRFDGWLEWVHAGPEPHTHSFYTSGLTLDGRLIGDALGPAAMSVTAGTDWTGSGSRLSVVGAWEHYSGDDWERRIYTRNGKQVDTDWLRIGNNPDEIRKRLVFDWTRLPESGRIEVLVRLGYEHVTRFGFTNKNRSSFLVWTRLGYIW